MTDYHPPEKPPTGENGVMKLAQFLLGAVCAIALLVFLSGQYSFKPPPVPDTPDRIVELRRGGGGPKNGNPGGSSYAYYVTHDDPLLMYDVQGCEKLYLSVHTTSPTEAYAQVFCENLGQIQPVLVDRDGDGKVE